MRVCTQSPDIWTIRIHARLRFKMRLAHLKYQYYGPEAKGEDANLVAWLHL